MKPFRFINAKSIQDAVNILKENNGRARIIAGGTDLIGALKDRVPSVSPEVLVNLKTVSNLAAIRNGNQTVEIDALVKVDEIAVSELIKRDFPVLAMAARSVGSPQIRNMGTLGGNLCQDARCWYYRTSPWAGNPFFCLRKGGRTCYAVTGDNRYHSICGARKGCFAVHPSDLASALIALDAKVKTNSREMAVGDLFDGFKGTVLDPHEILIRVEIAVPTPGTKSIYIKSRLRKAIDFAVVSIAAAVTIRDGLCQDARIVLGGVAPTPRRAKAAEAAIKGKPISPESAGQAAHEAADGTSALTKNAYKITLTKALVKKALLACR